MDSRAQTVDIFHLVYGVVQGVDNYIYKWGKDGAWYYRHEGWSQAPQPRWVDVTRECSIGECQAILHGDNYTQNHLYRRLMRDGCIIIEREVIS